MNLAAPRLVLADATRLRDGDSIHFEVRVDGVDRPAFAVRHAGIVHGWIDRCMHQARPLQPTGSAVLQSGVLTCAHHGATYDPISGACRGGPCEGRGLTPLEMREQDGSLWCDGRPEPGRPAPEASDPGPS